VEFLCQRSRANKFNHRKRLDKGQLLGRLVLMAVYLYGRFRLSLLNLCGRNNASESTLRHCSAAYMKRVILGA
ncbi:hypothetical protein N9C16_11625, partial [Paracoccaceae bacterium]|nr:hypothetical protein [Paracoccaceae bacterium]